MSKAPDIFKLPSALQCIDLGKWGISNHKVYVKRDDLIHHQVAGNKWRKLKHNINYFLAGSYKGIVTLGGAHSNHILAAAFLGRRILLCDPGPVTGYSFLALASGPFLPGVAFI